MQIISDGVRSSRPGHECGRFLLTNLNVLEISLLRSISENMRRKWNRHDIVPRPLLQIFFDWHYLPSKPENGLDLWKLLDWLNVGPYENVDHAEGSKILFEMIVDQEVKSRSSARKKLCKGF